MPYSGAKLSHVEYAASINGGSAIVFNIRSVAVAAVAPVINRFSGITIFAPMPGDPTEAHDCILQGVWFLCDLDRALLC